MYSKILSFLLILCAASVYAKSVIVSTKISECEWKNDTIEFRTKGKHPQKLLLKPYFTNGTKLKDARVDLFTSGSRVGLTLRGKNCSLSFTLSHIYPTIRVAVPRNAGFRVLTDTEAIVFPDQLGEDTLINSAKNTLTVPGIVPIFMGLQKGEKWTLSCIPFSSSSDIRVSADLKTWEFKPGNLEEYTFFIHSVPGIWHKMQDKLEYNIRKPITWKPPFKARFQFAYPLAKDFIDTGYPAHCVWSAGELTANKKRGKNVPPRSGITNPKAFIAWSSGFPGGFPYPVYLKDDGVIEAAYPVHRGKRVYDTSGPIYIYTYDGGAYPSNRLPAAVLDPHTGKDFSLVSRTTTPGIGPATCGATQKAEKIFYRSEARQKRAEIASEYACMQIFVEAIRCRIDNYRSWADEMILFCSNAAKTDPSAAKELEAVIKTLKQIEIFYQNALPQMKTPDEAYAMQVRMLADIDNKALDDEELEERAKAFGRATRAIGGAQDNCVAHCRYITKRLRQQVLRAYLESRNVTAKKVYKHVFRSGYEILRYPFNHEGK